MEEKKVKKVKKAKTVRKPRRKAAVKKKSSAATEEPSLSLKEFSVLKEFMAASRSDPVFRVEKWREVYAPNPAMLRLILTKEGYTVFQWTEFPGRMCGMRRHEPELCHWVVSGSVEIVLKDGGTYVLEAGDAVDAGGDLLFVSGARRRDAPLSHRRAEKVDRRTHSNRLFSPLHRHRSRLFWPNRARAVIFVDSDKHI